MVAGWIGSGKSTVARAAAEALGAELLVADEVRAELAAEGAAEAWLPGFSEKLYPELLARAEATLAAGRSVVLDGTFRSRARRAEARRIAERCGAPLLFVECRAPREVCRERLRRRGGAERAGGWLALFEHFVAHEWEPADELRAEEHLVLDTGRPPGDSLAELRARLG